MPSILLKIFLAVLVVPLSALNPISKTYASQTTRLKIVASFYPMYIMAKNVAQDVPGVVVQNLAPTLTGCLHDYTITTEDMRKLTDAQVFVANGAGMEPFLDKIKTQHPHLKVVQLSEGITLIKGTQGDNPHLWVSISNAIIQVKNLGRAMAEIDPLYKEFYQKNTVVYVTRLEALRKKMHAELAPYEGRTIITFHEAFSYFTQEFNFHVAAVIEKDPGSQPSAKELADTIELGKKKNVMALFSEPQYPSSAIQVIARETGAKVYVLDPAVIGPDNTDAYINIMENNLAILKESFSK